MEPLRPRSYAVRRPLQRTFGTRKDGDRTYRSDLAGAGVPGEGSWLPCGELTAGGPLVCPPQGLHTAEGLQTAIIQRVR